MRRRHRPLIAGALVAAVLGTALVANAAADESRDPATSPTQGSEPGSESRPAPQDQQDQQGQQDREQRPVRDEGKLPVPDGVFDEAVEFTVRNVNTSDVACNADGRTYTVRGHLTGPVSDLRSPASAVTLYEHGIAAGEWYWRVPVEGYHHAFEMARRGHTSLTIDRLGYDSSDQPAGTAMCVGSQASMADQITSKARRGEYRWSGEGASPTFAKVAMLGHSNGGQIAQIAAYSFGSIDGLVLSAWADGGLTEQANERFFSALGACMSGGRPASEGGETGYTYYDLGAEAFLSGNFTDSVEPEVADYAESMRNPHPCGDMVSQLAGVMVDMEQLPTVEVPTLMVYGDDDARVQRGANHRALFASTHPELELVRGGGHYYDLEPGGRDSVETLANWLDRHDLG